MRVRHLMIPDLDFASVDRMPLEDLVVRRTRMVSSFPATIPAQEATLLTGAPPAVHGVLFGDDTSRAPALIEGLHRRVDALVDGGTLADVASTIFEEMRESDVLLVSGCPIGDPVHRIVSPPPSAPEGFRLHPSDCFTLCEPIGDGATLPPDVIDAWLGTPGIERVLAPTIDSAGAWMAPADRGWILVAERGWAFRECSSAFGRIDPGREPVLLALGEDWTAPWPAAVHDWRIAPTVLAAEGSDTSGSFDAPLEGHPGQGS